MGEESDDVDDDDVDDDVDDGWDMRTGRARRAMYLSTYAGVIQIRKKRIAVGTSHRDNIHIISPADLHVQK